MKPPEDIYRALVQSGDQMADDSYTYRLLDDSTKPLLAQLTIEAKVVAGSMAEATQIALASPEYTQPLEGLRRSQPGSGEVQDQVLRNPVILRSLQDSRGDKPRSNGGGIMNDEQNKALILLIASIENSLRVIADAVKKEQEKE